MALILLDTKLDFRITYSERAKIEDAAETAELTVSEYIRHCLLELPLPSVTIVPKINRKKWCELARTTANLNQIARAINAGKSPELVHIRKCIAELNNHIYKLRQEMLGQSR